MARLFNFGSRKKPNAGEARPIRDARFVVIDTELTGLNSRKDSIVSVGAVRMTGGRILLGDSFYRLVKPKAALTRESIVIHGIRPADVVAEQDSAHVLSAFAAFCGNDVVVGHCVGIDYEFIDREMRQALDAPFENPALDTAALYEWIAKRQLFDQCLPMPPGESDLYTLARYLDIQVSEKHHALADAFVTAQLFQRLLPPLQAAAITTVADLQGIGDPLRGGDRFRSTGEIGNL